LTDLVDEQSLYDIVVGAVDGIVIELTNHNANYIGIIQGHTIRSYYFDNKFIEDLVWQLRTGNGISWGVRHEISSRLLHLDAISLKTHRRLLGMAAWNSLIDFECNSKLSNLF
jgi:hypothetical protein